MNMPLMPPTPELSLGPRFALDHRVCVLANRWGTRRAVGFFFGAVSRLGDGLFWYALMIGLIQLSFRAYLAGGQLHLHRAGLVSATDTVFADLYRAGRCLTGHSRFALPQRCIGRDRHWQWTGHIITVAAVAGDEPGLSHPHRVALDTICSRRHKPVGIQ
jgi:hypothetical protein